MIWFSESQENFLRKACARIFANLLSSGWKFSLKRPKFRKLRHFRNFLWVITTAGFWYPVWSGNNYFSIHSKAGLITKPQKFNFLVGQIENSTVVLVTLQSEGHLILKIYYWWPFLDPTIVWVRLHELQSRLLWRQSDMTILVAERMFSNVTNWGGAV